MTRYLRLSAGLIALLVVAGAAALFVGRDATAQQSFFDPCGGGTLADTAAGATSDITGKFGIGIGADCVPLTGDDPAGGNYNSGGLVNFTPPEWVVAKDEDITDGTKVGSFGSRAVLGLLNNACNTVLSVPFDLLDGTTDQGNPIDAKAEGQPDRLSVIAADADSNGIPDGAEKWPSYLDKVAQKAGMDLTKLVARFVGFNTRSVSGTTVVLNFLVFEPGAKISNLINLDPRLGYPAVTVLQDPSGTASSSDPVSDFCAPLYTESTLFGTAGGATFRKNPGAGTYNFVTYVASAPDEDQDGIENSLDPCGTKPNASGWDPRLAKFVGQPGDQDADGIPDDCDPFPAVPSACVADSGISGADEDCDGWQNRGDNCAIDANEDQADADSDGLGDACDPDDSVRSQQFVKCLVSTADIGGGGTAPVDPNTLAPCDPNAQVPTGSGTPAPSGSGTPLPSGVTPKPSTGSGSGTGVGTGPAGGVGSLSPTAVSFPVWAGVFAAIGALGLLGGFTMMGSRLRRRR